METMGKEPMKQWLGIPSKSQKRKSKKRGPKKKVQEVRGGDLGTTERMLPMFTLAKKDPEEKPYRGVLGETANIMIYTLANAHELYKEEPEALGTRKIAKQVFKTNGEHPSHEAVAKALERMEARNSFLLDNFKRKPGSGRPPKYGNAQKQEIAEALMYHKSIRGYPIF